MNEECKSKVVSSLFLVIWKSISGLGTILIFFNINRILALFYCTDGRYPLANEEKAASFFKSTMTWLYYVYIKNNFL